jgi:putative hydrolase of the HAD superfamily
LILDFGGVVTTSFYGALRGFCLREGLPGDAVERALKDTPQGRQFLALAECGQIPQREFEFVLAKLLDVDADGLVARVLSDLRPCTPVLDLVADARAAGTATAVLSNSWGSGDVDPYAGYDLPEHFDTVVISDRVGLRKPDPAIYRLTADRLGVQAWACVFVDDSAHNLPPAAALGMATVLFTDVDTGITRIREFLATG